MNLNNAEIQWSNKILEFHPYHFIKHSFLDLLPSKTVLPLRTRRTPHRFVVLDLDETLIYRSFTELKSFDIRYSVTFKENKSEVFVHARPH